MLFSSPLEFLAAFALAFAAGVMASWVFAVYGRWVRRQGRLAV
jgi:hypothetical protein